MRPKPGAELRGPIETISDEKNAFSRWGNRHEWLCPDLQQPPQKKERFPKTCPEKQPQKKGGSVTMSKRSPLDVEPWLKLQLTGNRRAVPPGEVSPLGARSLRRGKAGKLGGDWGKLGMRRCVFLVLFKFSNWQRCIFPSFAIVLTIFSFFSPPPPKGWEIHIAHILSVPKGVGAFWGLPDS